MQPKYLPLPTFVYNTFNTPNLGNYSPYELVFDWKPKLPLSLEAMPIIKVSGTFTNYYNLLNKRLQYLCKLLQDSIFKKLSMINKDRSFFQYNSGDLVHIISLLMGQLHTSSRNVMTKYVGPVVIYKVIDPHNYLLMTLDGKILRGLFEHERLKLANVRTGQWNVQNLAHWKQVINDGLNV